MRQPVIQQQHGAPLGAGLQHGALVLPKEPQ